MVTSIFITYLSSQKSLLINGFIAFVCTVSVNQFELFGQMPIELKGVISLYAFTVIWIVLNEVSVRLGISSFSERIT